MDERGIKAAQDLIHQLSLDYEAGQIFLTKYNSANGDTRVLPFGFGDLFIRMGQVTSWLEEPKDSKCVGQGFLEKVLELRKYYTVGQFFVSEYDSDKNKTSIINFGFGNIFSRKTAVALWENKIYSLLSQENDEEENE